MTLLQRLASIGGTVVCFRADGCMAHDDVFLWWGIIKSWNKRDGEHFAAIEIIKWGHKPGDIRDGQLGFEYAYETELQNIFPGSYMVMR